MRDYFCEVPDHTYRSEGDNFLINIYGKHVALLNLLNKTIVIFDNIRELAELSETLSFIVSDQTFEPDNWSDDELPF